MRDLDRIYRENFIRVYRYILSISGDEHMAEDITQETFYRAMRKLNTFRGDSSMATWLCRIARNLLLNYADREKRSNAAADEMKRGETSTGSAEAEAIRKETGQAIRAAIQKMKDPYGEVLSLRLYGEMSFAEIGRLFEKSDSWARVTYHRARMMIKEELKDENQM